MKQLHIPGNLKATIYINMRSQRNMIYPIIVWTIAPRVPRPQK